MAQKNVIVTKQRRSDLVKASAGAIELPVIVGMAFGNGGAGPPGEAVAPDEGQTELKNELFRKENDTYSFVDDTTCRYECTLTEEELADEYINEIGLYDVNGNIVCIKTFRPKGKDGDLQMTFLLDDMF